MQELTSLSAVLSKALGHINPAHRKVCDAFIKKHDIPIAGVVPMGRGTSYLITQETADEVIAIVNREKPLVTEEPESPSEIHIGALETKCDRIETGIKRLQDEVAVLVKANNVLADKLSKVLSSLGAN